MPNLALHVKAGSAHAYWVREHLFRFLTTAEDTGGSRRRPTPRAHRAGRAATITPLDDHQPSGSLPPPLVNRWELEREARHGDGDARV